jgi:hypothetical protein
LLRLPATTKYATALALSLSWRLVSKSTAALALPRCLVSKETTATASRQFVAEQPATGGRRRLCAKQGATRCSALLVSKDAAATAAAAAACPLSEYAGCCGCLLIEEAATCGGLPTKDAAASAASATSCDALSPKATPASLGAEHATRGSGCKCGRRLTLRLCDSLLNIVDRAGDVSIGCDADMGR